MQAHTHTHPRSHTHKHGQNNLNLCIQIEPVMPGGDATVYVWLHPQIYVHKIQTNTVASTQDMPGLVFMRRFWILTSKISWHNSLLSSNKVNNNQAIYNIIAQPPRFHILYNVHNMITAAKSINSSWINAYLITLLSYS